MVTTVNLEVDGLYFQGCYGPTPSPRMLNRDHLNRDLAVRESFARDASGLWRVSDAIARPSSAAEISALLAQAHADRTAVTPAGSQTSTTGASICDHGMILSTRSLTAITDLDTHARTVRVGPGVLLGDLQRAIAAEGLFFAPDPTSDQECTVGGAIACNASGPRTLRYGPTRAHVRSVTVALAGGRIERFQRSEVEKNTVGLFPAQDPVDWFIGSEGILGVIVEAELALLPRPQAEIGLAIPFPDESRALAAIIAARESRSLSPRCLEYFDAECFAIARQGQGDAHWAPEAGAMVYTEATTYGDALPQLDEWLALAEAYGAHAQDVRVFDGDAAIREARRLRHGVPATMHERVAPYLKDGGRRVSTDWAVPWRLAPHAVKLARSHAFEAGVEPGVVYGHLGNGHPHQNFIARNPDEVKQFEQVVERTLRDVIAMGGTVAAEHGIGKVKSRWLPLQMHASQVTLMRALKADLDPHGIMAPGNILA